MCGICGIVTFTKSERIAPGLIRAMTDSLVHRGPDSEGFHVEPHVALGARRLSIIDLPGGNQPISNETKDVWIVYNGEIYNFREVRKDLQSFGHLFQTGSDTEVVVHAYEQWGVACLDRLVGMFGFALWDRKRKRLFVARDRLGIKPIYYEITSDSIAFASELKAILQLPREHRVNLRALELFTTYGYIPSPYTIFEGIHKLPPAHYLVADGNGITIDQYWDVVPERSLDESVSHLSSELLDRLRDAVRAHMVSDVPVGAFLSGGLDSSTVVAFMSQAAEKRVQTFSIGFADKQYSELPYAREVARRFGTEHREFVLGPETAQQLPDVIARLDEPFGDSSAIPTYLVSKAAAQHVKVVLCGDGGDEIFGGYEWQRRYQFTRYFQSLPPPILKSLPAVGAIATLPISRHPARLKLTNFLADASSTPEAGYLRRMTLMPKPERSLLWRPEIRASWDGWSSDDVLLQWVRRHDSIDFRNRMMYSDLHFYCPEDCLTKVDRMSMAWSIEARVPMLDHRLVEFMAQIPADLRFRRLTSKVLLRRAVRDLLPLSVLRKRKQGFSIPLASWLRHPLRDFVADMLLGKDARIYEWFQPDIVARIVGDHLHARQDYSHRVWALLALEAWARQYLTPPARTLSGTPLGA